MKSLYHIICLVTCLLVLAACSSTPPITEDNLSLQNARQLLSDANAATPNDAIAMRIEAARQLLALNKPRQALEALQLNHRYSVPDSLIARYSSTMAEAYLALGDTEAARQLLLDNSALNDSFLMLPNEEQIELGRLRGQLLGQLGEPMASAREFVFIASIASKADARRFHDATWQALMNTSLPELLQTARSTSSNDSDFAGWLALAIIGKQNQGDLDAQIAALSRWQDANPQHPAAKHPPGGLAILKTLSANRPKQVAVLLPFAGRYAAPGQAVRDGLMAAWYQARQAGSQVPELRFYDTAGTTDFETLYQQAVSDGAQFIIGPLDKDKLRLLFDMGKLPVPTLALNEVLDYGQPPSGLYQFSLSADQEVGQLVTRMAASGHTHLILAYSPEPWALRTADTFNTQWQQDEQHILGTAQWERSRDMPGALKQTLGINRSEDRQKNLENLLGTRLEFEPRRRQDVDAMVLIASPDTGRLLMPMLQFLYAGNIPAYATSHIFTGTPNPDADRDLDRVRFCDMGWLLQDSHPLRDNLKPWINPKQSPYLRLYALGADAFLIHPRLPQLEQYPGSVFFGYTGQLRLNEERHMHRELDCAVFYKGKPRPLPAIVAQPHAPTFQ